MKALPALRLLFAGLAPPLCAGPVDDAIVAAMRLAEQPSYAWVTTVTDDARRYDISGRTMRDGYTRVTMPAVNTLRRRLGRSVTDTHVAFIFRGNVACVVETEAGWRRPDELPPEPPLSAPPAVRGGAGVSAGAATLPLPTAPRAKPDSGPRAYSNLQPGLSHPHEDLGLIVAGHESLVVEADTITGTLTETGARLLLVRDGQEAITPVRARGTFQLWRRGDLIVRYRVTLRGTLSIQLPGGARSIEVSQTSETFVTEVGAAAFEVPDEVRTRLGG